MVVLLSKGKGQSGVELTVLLGLGLIIILALIMSSQETIHTTQTSYHHKTATLTLDDLTHAATLVYEEGVGSRRKVYIRIPPGVTGSSVSEQTLGLTLASRNGIANVHRSTDFRVVGSIPTQEGSYYLTVEAKEDYVIIRSALVEYSPSHFNTQLFATNSTTYTLELTNLIPDPVSVNVGFVGFAALNPILSDTSFTLTGNEKRNITLQLTVPASPSNFYANYLTLDANTSNQAQNNTITASITVLTPQVENNVDQNISLYPEIWNVGMMTINSTTGRDFFLCNNVNQPVLVNMSIVGPTTNYTSFSDTSNLLSTSVNFLSSDCSLVPVYVNTSTSTNTSYGNYTVNVHANASVGSDTSLINFSIADFTPIALNINLSAYGQFENINISGSFFTPNGTVRIWLNETPTTIIAGYPVTFPADALGNWSHIYNTNDSCDTTFTIFAEDVATGQIASVNFDVLVGQIDFFDGFENGSYATYWNITSTFDGSRFTDGWRVIDDNDNAVNGGDLDPITGTYSSFVAGLQGNDNVKQHNPSLNLTLNLSGMTYVDLNFSHWCEGSFDKSGNLIDYLYIDVYDGTWHKGVVTWLGLGGVSGGLSGCPGSPDTMHINLSAFNKTDPFMINFRYNATGEDEYWYIDDINVTARATCTQQNIKDYAAPFISQDSPPNGYSTFNDDITFEYDVNDLNNQVAFCEFILDGVPVDNDTSISEATPQYFTVYNMPVGTHTWQINCTDTSPQANEGKSENWTIIIKGTEQYTLNPYFAFEEDATPTWSTEFDNPDGTYARAIDDTFVYPPADFIEFYFPSPGIGGDASYSDLTVSIRHRDTNLTNSSAFPDPERHMISCYNSTDYINITPYSVPGEGTTWIDYFNDSVTGCIPNNNASNNMRIRMSYDPFSGTGGYVDVDFVEIEFTASR